MRAHLSLQNAATGTLALKQRVMAFNSRRILLLASFLSEVFVERFEALVEVLLELSKTFFKPFRSSLVPYPLLVHKPYQLACVIDDISDNCHPILQVQFVY